MTHQAHRYGAPKAYPYMVKYADGSVDASDLLMAFVGSMPNLEPEGLVRLMGKKNGTLGQHFVFQTTLPCPADAVNYWHGTTYHCLRDILTVGLKNPYDMTRTFQEFKEVHITQSPAHPLFDQQTYMTWNILVSHGAHFESRVRVGRRTRSCGVLVARVLEQAGIYVADKLTRGGAFWHAIPTRFAAEDDARVPYTRVVLKVACRGQPMARRSYGDCDQLVFDESQVVVREVHPCRQYATLLLLQNYYHIVIQ